MMYMRYPLISYWTKVTRGIFTHAVKKLRSKPISLSSKNTSWYSYQFCCDSLLPGPEFFKHVFEIKYVMISFSIAYINWILISARVFYIKMHVTIFYGFFLNLRVKEEILIKCYKVRARWYAWFHRNLIPVIYGL